MNKPLTPTTVLLISARDERASLFEQTLHAGSPAPGWTFVQGGDGRGLAHQVEAHAPNQVVVLGTPVPDLAQALSPWRGEPILPISWFAPPPSLEHLEKLLALGLTGWWPDMGWSNASLNAALTQDRLRWLGHKNQVQELAQVRGQLSDRKYLDRAKGVLAQARGLDEDEAFKLLRGAAMHANLKIGDVSRSVIEAAAWADALNRAGQLRMLSQRVVKLAAQRLANVDAHRARRLQEESEQRAQANLDALSALPSLNTQGEALPQALALTRDAWTVLQASLGPRKSTTLLQDTDDKATALLDQAEILVKALEACSGRRALTVVNLCGRQRMLAQRLAKEALLAGLLNDDHRRASLAALRSDFETALLELEMAPLSSPEIRGALKTARDEWTHLLAGLRFLDKPESQLAISRASEALLAVFEGLTTQYEHSLQVIMS